MLLDKGQDIDAYFFAAQKLTNDNILFLNSFSKILADNWLSFYVKAMDSYEKVIVGASGSYHSHYSNVFIMHKIGLEPAKGFKYNFRKYKLFIKAFFYWRFIFKPFPSPHLRTSSFMMKRQDFLSVYPGPLINKFNAYKFESGKNGLTNHYLKKEYKLLVIDKHGRSYENNQWQASRTFWIADQENLLVSDNQTELYALSTSAEKQLLTFKAWGVND